MLKVFIEAAMVLPHHQTITIYNSMVHLFSALVGKVDSSDSRLASWRALHSVPSYSDYAKSQDEVSDADKVHLEQCMENLWQALKTSFSGEVRPFSSQAGLT